MFARTHPLYFIQLLDGTYFRFPVFYFHLKILFQFSLFYVCLKISLSRVGFCHVEDLSFIRRRKDQRHRIWWHRLRWPNDQVFPGIHDVSLFPHITFKTTLSVFTTRVNAGAPVAPFRISFMGSWKLNWSMGTINFDQDLFSEKVRFTLYLVSFPSIRLTGSYTHSMVAWRIDPSFKPAWFCQPWTNYAHTC